MTCSARAWRVPAFLVLALAATATPALEARVRAGPPPYIPRLPVTLEIRVDPDLQQVGTFVINWDAANGSVPPGTPLSIVLPFPAEGFVVPPGVYYSPSWDGFVTRFLFQVPADLVSARTFRFRIRPPLELPPPPGLRRSDQRSAFYAIEGSPGPDTREASDLRVIVFRSRDFYANPTPPRQPSGERTLEVAPSDVTFTFEGWSVAAVNKTLSKVELPEYRWPRADLEKDNLRLLLKPRALPQAISFPVQTPVATTGVTEKAAGGRSPGFGQQLIQLMLMLVVHVLIGGMATFLAWVPDMVPRRRSRIGCEVVLWSADGVVLSVLYYFGGREVPGFEWSLFLIVILLGTSGLYTILIEAKGQPVIPPPPRRITVLFVGSVPSNQDNLDIAKEFRDISEEIQLGKCRDRFEVIPSLAARWADVRRYLITRRPGIIHFCGHADEHGRIVLRNYDERGEPVDQEALLKLIGVLKDDIKLAFLNACYTGGQATALANSISCAIGIENPIPDQSAIDFAINFYIAIANGDPVSEAFEIAAGQVAGQGSPREFSGGDDRLGKSTAPGPVPRIAWNTGIKDRKKFTLVHLEAPPAGLS